MKVTVTVIALVLLAIAIAWGAVACGESTAAPSGPAAPPPPTVMGIQTGPDRTVSHQLLEGGGAPNPAPIDRTDTETTWSHQLLEY